MILNIGITVVASIVALVVSTLFSRVVFGGNGFINWIVQQLVLIGLAYTLLTLGVVGMVGAVIVAALPTLLRIVFWSFLIVMSYRALKGSFGKETQWAAELFKEGDTEFIRAVKALPQNELVEIRIIAETKDGLRDLTIERYEQLSEQ